MLDKIKNITCFIQDRIEDFTADTAIVLGSGLGGVATLVNPTHIIEYQELEHLGFPASTIQGHQGRFIFGDWAGRNVIIMQGRVHYYQGYTPAEVVMPLRILSMLGVNKVVLSNAAGGLNRDYNVGDIMVIDDHISFIPNPLIGDNISELGVRFPSMSQPYDKEYIKIAHQVAQELDIEVHQGCYVAVTGPSYETKAEVKYYRMIGGDAVGMSTAPEVIAANHAGMRVFAISLITNKAVSSDDEPAPTHDEVLEAGDMVGEKLATFVKNVIFNF